MPSPQRLFRGMTLAELQALRATAILRITNGDFTNLSGAGKSSTRKWEMSPQEILDEVNYEIEVITGTRPPSTVYQDFSGLRPMPNTLQA